MCGHASRFVEGLFPGQIAHRASAQGLFNFLILGLGPIVGNFAGGLLEAAFTTGTGSAAVTDFRKLFLVPAVMALVAAAILFLFFRPPLKADVTTEEALEDARAIGSIIQVCLAMVQLVIISCLQNDPEKAKRELGWEPRIGLDPFLEDMLTADAAVAQP